MLKPGYTEASTVLEAWPFSFTFSMKDAYVYFFSFEDGWTQSADTDFIPYKAGFSFNWDWDSKPLWKNRIFLNTSVDSVWQMNLQQFTDNLFTFNLDFSLVITDFLDLRLKTSSENTATHLYIPSFMEEAGREPVLIINDFLDSFNFFNSAKRRASHFNLKKISFEAIHKLEDWDLSLSYSGEPELDTSKEIYEYQWKTYFTVMMQWNPIPEIKTEIVQDKSGDIYF